MTKNKLVRDMLGSPVPQSADGNGGVVVRATGDTTGINFGKTKLLRDVLGSPIPNQIYDVDARKWVIDEGGSSPIGDTIAWSNITNKPTSYPPQSHTHEIANVNGLQVALNNKADGEDLTELERQTNEHLAQITWYDATLINGFNGRVLYGKNQHGTMFVKIYISVITTNDAGTVVCNIPTTYRPDTILPIPINKTNTAPYNTTFSMSLHPSTGNLSLVFNHDLPVGSDLGLQGEVVYIASN